MPSSSPHNSPERPALLDILVSAFSGALFVLFLSKLRSPIDKAADSRHSHGSTNRSADDPVDHSPRRVRFTETNSRPTPPQREHAEAPERWWKRWKPYVFLLNLATFAVVAWYACVTNRIWHEMRRTNELTQETLWRQNQPWVGIPGPISPSGNSQIEWTIRNYGTSPARRIVVDAYAIEEKIARTWKTMRPCNDSALESINDPSQQANVLFPSDKLTGSSIVKENVQITQGHRFIAVCVTYQGRDFAFVDAHGWPTRIYNTKYIYIGKTKNGLDATPVEPIDHFELRDADAYDASR